MNCIGTYDGTIFYNPANKFCIISVKTADQSVPAEARSNRRYKDHLIRFTAVGYEIPRTDAVELELDGEWAKGKYGVQLQVEQWREIVPRTKNGVEGYLASGLIKGIGPKTAADIVERFGVATLDILEHQPERLLEIRGITENKLEDIRASYAENRMLQGIMTLLAPFKITPKTALKIYQYFGPTSVEILEKSPFELCQISGFGFRRVDAIVQKSGGDLHDPMGSEYETVIMPLLKAHTIMMYRNLLYTGITRAKKRVVLIGQKQVLFMAIHRNEIGKRNTLLGMRIQMYFKAYAKKAGIPIPAALEEQLKNAS